MGEYLLLGGDPLIRRLFTTAGTKATFTTEGHFFEVAARAITAAIKRITSDTQTTTEHRDDVIDNRLSQCTVVLLVEVLPRVAHLKQLPKWGGNSHQNNPRLSAKHSSSQLALTYFSGPHLIHGPLAATWTANRVFELRALGVGRHRDVTYLAIKDVATLAAVEVDEHRLPCVI